VRPADHGDVHGIADGRQADGGAACHDGPIVEPNLDPAGMAAMLDVGERPALPTNVQAP